MTDQKKTDWVRRKCVPCEGGVQPMSEFDVRQGLKSLEGWEFENGWIVRTFTFENFFQTSSFIDVVAWVANREDHHPDIEAGYKACTVRYKTHAIDGISDNDFICAAKINAILNL